MIAQDIQALAASKNIELDAVPSGGRHDLLVFSPNGDSKPVFILENPDNGDGPSSAAQKVGVICYPNIDMWRDCVEAIFPDAETALTWLGDQDFRSALSFEMSGLLTRVEAQQTAAACVVWSEEGTRELEKQDYTFHEMATQVINRSGCEFVYAPHPVPIDPEDE